MQANSSRNTAASEVTIPTTGTPNNYVAPFWDDLDNAPTSSVSSQVLGSGTTRRLVVEQPTLDGLREGDYVQIVGNRVRLF